MRICISSRGALTHAKHASRNSSASHPGGASCVHCKYMSTSSNLGKNEANLIATTHPSDLFKSLLEQGISIKAAKRTFQSTAFDV
eukprot:3100712-Amphidinium_carterae.2